MFPPCGQAYFFGFNRRQVVQAESLGETVWLQFASAKDREVALEVYRNLRQPEDD
jgi:hypothetical protein